MISLNKKFLSAAFLLATLFSLAYPNKADAQLRSVISVTACTGVGNLIGQRLSGLVNQNLANLTNQLPANVRKFLGIGGVTGGFTGSSVPVNDNSTQNKIDNFNRNWINKESRMDIIARCIARETTDKMIGNTLNVIRNHGRDGGPSFVKNWRNFLTGGQYRGENIFRALLSNTKLCDHFNQGLKSTFRATTPTNLRGQNTRVGGFDPYQLKADCTMPANWSLDNYQKDFSGNGGWLAFAKLTEPQNNFLGSYTMALTEAEKQREFEQTIDITEAGGSGGGFTSRRGQGQSGRCLLRSDNGQCMVYKDILTPGSVLQQSVGATVQQEIAWVTNADEISEVISNFTSQLLNRLLDLSNNNESRTIDPADLPEYIPVEPGVDDPSSGGNPGEIDNPPPTPTPPSPCDPNDPDCIPPPGQNGLIFGYVFEDSNEDGIRDSEEPLISNSIVYLQTPDESAVLQTNQTFQGIYTFQGLNESQEYRVSHLVPSGFKKTTDDSLILTPTVGGISHDFGIAPE